jgi:hypothetical protein
MNFKGQLKTMEKGRVSLALHVPTQALFNYTTPGQIESGETFPSRVINNNWINMFG